MMGTLEDAVTPLEQQFDAAERYGLSEEDGNLLVYPGGHGFMLDREGALFLTQSLTRFMDDIGL
jgi:hypothetical protein